MRCIMLRHVLLKVNLECVPGLGCLLLDFEVMEDTVFCCTGVGTVPHVSVTGCD